MHTISTLPFTTVTGAQAEAVFATPGDGRLLTKVSVQVRGEAVTGWVERVSEARDPATQPAKAMRDFHATLRDRGATHYLSVPEATLGLDTDTANLFAARMDDALIEAERIKAERNAQAEAAIRATGTVRRVLRHSPAWPDPYGLEEAYPTTDARDAAWVRYGVPGVESIRVHPRCPSLRAVQARSPAWGQFPGHGNILSLVSDADWDLLVAETTEQDRLDAARTAQHAERDTAHLAGLRAVAVPAEAIAAFRRYSGCAEAAWEDADEDAASLIRRYGNAIEAQGIGSAAVDRSVPAHYPPGA